MLVDVSINVKFCTRQPFPIFGPIRSEAFRKQEVLTVVVTRSVGSDMMCLNWMILAQNHLPKVLLRLRRLMYTNLVVKRRPSVPGDAALHH